jgi:hypothetical protein
VAVILSVAVKVETAVVIVMTVIAKTTIVGAIQNGLDEAIILSVILSTKALAVSRTGVNVLMEIVLVITDIVVAITIV